MHEIHFISYLQMQLFWHFSQCWTSKKYESGHFCSKLFAHKITVKTRVAIFIIFIIFVYIFIFIKIKNIVLIDYISNLIIY